MTSPEEFKERYSGNARGRMNKAIRAECPGGSETLEARAMFCSISRRHSGEEKKIADIAQERLDSIRSDMAAHIRKKYGLPE